MSDLAKALATVETIRAREVGSEGYGQAELQMMALADALAEERKAKEDVEAKLKVESEGLKNWMHANADLTIERDRAESRAAAAEADLKKLAALMRDKGEISTGKLAQYVGWTLSDVAAYDAVLAERDQARKEAREFREKLADLRKRVPGPAIALLSGYESMRAERDDLKAKLERANSATWGWAHKYDKLEAENSALRSRLDGARGFIEKECEVCKHNANGCHVVGCYLDCARKALAALASESGDAEPFPVVYKRVLDKAIELLAKANAERKDPKDWPAGQAWNEIGHSSYCSFMRRAREELGIDHAWFKSRVEATPECEVIYEASMSGRSEGDAEREAEKAVVEAMERELSAWRETFGPAHMGAAHWPGSCEICDAAEMTNRARAAREGK